MKRSTNHILTTHTGSLPRPRDVVDSVIVGYYEEGQLYYAAKVRNGFVPQVRREVFQRFKNLEIDSCPFVNLPEKKRTMWALTREEMKNCVAQASASSADRVR
jgi:ATP-dependent DNA ligase